MHDAALNEHRQLGIRSDPKEQFTSQFRVRVNSQDGVVMTRYRDSFMVQTGEYRIRKEDLPLYQVYFCKEGSLDLCVRPLEANQVTGRTCRRVTPGLWYR